MNDKIPEKGRRTKGAVAAFLSGVLLHIALLLLWAAGPSDVVGLLTGLSSQLADENRSLKFPLAAVCFVAFCWWTIALYRKRLMPLTVQLSYAGLAVFLGWVGIWIFIASMSLTFIK